MCDKAFDTCPFVFDSVPHCYKTQEMCDKAVDAFLPKLKFVPDWFVTNKTLEKLDDVVAYNDDIDLDDIDFGTITLFSDDMGLLTKDLNNINLNADNFGEDDPETIIHVRLMAWCNRFKQRKTCKKIRWRINAYSMEGRIGV